MIFLNNFNKKSSVSHIAYSEEIEAAVNSAESVIKKHYPDANSRWLSLRLLENNREFIKTIDYILDDEYLDFMIERNMKYVKETFKENK